MCANAAPELFALDDEGELRLLQDVVPEELSRRAETAVRMCPVAALGVER
jgi:ferredoxin